VITVTTTNPTPLQQKPMRLGHLTADQWEKEYNALRQDAKASIESLTRQHKYAQYEIKRLRLALAEAKNLITNQLQEAA